MPALSKDEINYLVHHIVLPPKLPEADDFNARNEQILLETTIEVLRDFRAIVARSNFNAAHHVELAVSSISNLLHSRDGDGRVAEVELVKLFHDLATDASSGAVPLEIKAQNAGIIVSRIDGHIVFEVFGLSPRNQEVMTTKGRLIRSFPTYACSIPLDRFLEEGFICAISHTISKLSSQEIREFRPTAAKAGTHIAETRDTIHPGMVTDFLINMLCATGHSTDTSAIWKHTREDVLWNNALHPWRRSALWLLVRVTMQLHFARLGSESPSTNTMYKAIVANVLAKISEFVKDSHDTNNVEQLFAISAKLTRRLRKLTPEKSGSCYQHYIKPAQEAMASTVRFLDGKWKHVLNDTKYNIRSDIAESLQPLEDCNFGLHELDKFIGQIADRKKRPSKAEFKPTLGYSMFSPSDLPSAFPASGEYGYFQLMAVEKWVEDHLSSWLQCHIDDESTCGRLGTLIKSYHNAAIGRYSNTNIPRSLSIMYLTIAELWVACDRCVCHLEPLHQDFDPEARVESLLFLSLPFKSQLERLNEVGSYVLSRRIKAKERNAKAVSLFHEFGHPSSFAVRYFDQSLALQQLRSRIEKTAEVERRQKREELARKQNEYNELMSQSNENFCVCDKGEVTCYDDHEKYTTIEYTPPCKKCDLAGQAEGITIALHEWPLSSNDTIAKATIFELRIPNAFRNWRDITLYLMIDVLGFKIVECSKRNPPTWSLEAHRDLSHLRSFPPEQRMQIRSQVKSWNVSHYGKEKAVHSVVESNICVDNALVYQYYNEKRPMEALQLTGKVSEDCTYKLPDRASQLQLYLQAASRTEPVTPNFVVASLSKCPSYMTIHEYKAFGTLSIGYNIRYMNILTQLAMPSIDFSKSETQCLIRQLIHQAGPRENISSFGWASHHLLTDVSFCQALIKQLEASLCRVSQNWESWRALETFVQLTLRVLSFSSFNTMKTQCLEFLEAARQISLRWLDTLKQRAQRNDAQRVGLCSRACEIALLCSSTFDVDDMFLKDLLESPPKISALFQCSIVIQENKDAAFSEHKYLFQAMLQSWRLLLFRAFLILNNEGFSESFETGLNQAVTTSWASFRPANRWAPLSSPLDHCFHVKCDALNVHFNVLTAELQVNALPLSRLPREYLAHQTYASLFRQSEIEVTPTNEPGMSFSAKYTYEGYELSFGMQRKDMIIVAAQDTEKLDFVPQHLFKDHLPEAFVRNYFHWYNHHTKEVEFRPRKEPWAPSTAMWKLKRVGSSWNLTKGHRCLLNPASHSSLILSKSLSPLEISSHIHVIFDKHSSVTAIELPRLLLDFEVNSGEHQIYSRQYRGMVIDTNQAIGTLVGLSSKLVLRHVKDLDDRLALIPEGSVKFAKTRDHVHISIDPDTTVKIHAYQVDVTLGRIIDNGSLQSKLLLCYLHALTSYCLPDILTRHTGTEAALSILRSAGTLSFECLTEPNIALLSLIAKLTPAREYYPKYKTEMQKVNWDSRLSYLSQHPEFYTEIESILKIAQKQKLFHPERTTMVSIERHPIHSELLCRDKIRTSLFRVDGFGGEHEAGQYDKIYVKRGRVDAIERGEHAYTAAKMILRGGMKSNSVIDPKKLQRSLKNIHFGKVLVQGPGQGLKQAELRFDSKWLEAPSSFLPDLWCKFHAALSSSRCSFNKFEMAIWLSTVAFAKLADMDVVEALAAFYIIPELASVAIPQVSAFKLSKGTRPTTQGIKSIIQSQCRAFETCPGDKLPTQEKEESEHQWLLRKQQRFTTLSNRLLDDVATALEVQWRCKQPEVPGVKDAETYIDTQKATSIVSSLFKACYDNRRFFKYIGNVADVLAQQDSDAVSIEQISEIKPLKPSIKKKLHRRSRVEDIFAIDAPLPRQLSPNQDTLRWPDPPNELILPLEEYSIHGYSTSTNDRLVMLFNELDSQSKSAYEKDYIADLRNSCKSLLVQKPSIRLRVDYPDCKRMAKVEAYSDDCQRYFMKLSLFFEDAIKSCGDVAAHTPHFPRICPTFWLRQLNKDHFNTLSEEWKEAVIKYGLAITDLQRSQRLRARASNPHDLAEELRNRGHQNWDPADFPETLLLEAESGILVREVQEEIAKQMRDPPGGQNSVMQLNMGEGKSTVIVPIVAMALADTKRLVRVIVAKPQSKQMCQMLVSKLGGLLNRRIYHMPFSRALKLSTKETNTLQEIFQNCMSNRGILLVQPEHILSFKLMGVEHIISNKTGIGPSLLRTQEFFDTCSRDIVDESDENFSVKFELVYTTGTQKPIQMCPERWVIIHSMLGLVSHYAAEVKMRLPSSIEVDDRWVDSGRYPRVRLLQNDAEDMLLDMITNHVCTIAFPHLPIARQPESAQNALYRYIRHSNLTSEEIKAVETGSIWNQASKDALLLVRGLIAGGILRFTLMSKRWRVNFGLDSIRAPKTKLAVPYRAKDSPSLRSEFSHPDVLLVLTSLTYYYGGLDDESLFSTFDHLLASDQADVEYEEWVCTTGSLPEAFRSLAGVNIKDRHQCLTQIFPLLRYSKGAIDYFLSHIVFPKEMKEFPHKLSASGWDIGAVKSHPITGFSGTNDSRHVLPLNVRHLDLEKQNHTNALVLSYLVQDENSVKLLRPQINTATSDGEELLRIVNQMETPPRVILDVGAQILDLNNYQVAQAWLRMSDPSTTEAAIFFNDNEELAVLDRSGRVELLQTSAFAKDLKVCLVYLDEAHTRGTDLKLPKSYRAAVTLGAHLTKDRLVQACMRLRQLGKGQSVVFCIPEEIQRKIMERTSVTRTMDITVPDVLVWTISETWADLRRSMPLWATQGRRFEQHKGLIDGVDTIPSRAKKFLEKESQTIEFRYRPYSQEVSNIASLNDWDTSNVNIKRILKRCQDFETLKFSSATLQEEQERELSPEIEEERQVQRPASATPEPHRLHAHLRHFVEKGEVPEGSDAFVPAFKALSLISAAKSHAIPQVPGTLLVTADFMRTVKSTLSIHDNATHFQDSYLRPVQWVLSAFKKSSDPFTRRLVIISPYEADILMLKLRGSNLLATLHLYSPRLSLTYKSLDKLDLFCIGSPYSSLDTNTISRSDIVQLNLFAGQQYFGSYEEYVELCEYLGLAYSAAKEGHDVQADGFVVPPIGKWNLKTSPVQILRELMKIRREGESMEKTHLGKVLNGDLLEKKDFQ